MSESTHETATPAQFAEEIRAALKDADGVRATELATRLLALEPDAILGHRALATVAHRQKRHADALDGFEALSRMEPAEASHAYMCGLILEDTGKNDDAVDAFAEALRRNPKYTPARVRLGAMAPERLAQLDRGTPSGGRGPGGGPRTGLPGHTGGGEDGGHHPEPTAQTAPSVIDDSADESPFGGDYRSYSAELLSVLDAAPEKLASFFPGEPTDVLHRRPASFLTGWTVAVVALIGAAAAGLSGAWSWALLFVLATAASGWWLFSAIRAYRLTLRPFRIDVEYGVLLRRHIVIWIYKVQEVDVVQTPWLSLIGSARLDVYSDPVRRQNSAERVKLRGVASPEELYALAEDLRRDAIHQRRVLKLNFV
jgi:membrane protein YdbS with pleckstrin-like domain